MVSLMALLLYMNVIPVIITCKYYSLNICDLITFTTLTVCKYFLPFYQFNLEYKKCYIIGYFFAHLAACSS